MAKLPYRLDAFAKREDDPLRPFSLAISEPELHPEFGYQCVIDCPLIREKKFTLFGDEPLFTAELCVQFVKRLLQFSETEVVDENGHLVEFPSFDVPRDAEPITLEQTLRIEDGTDGLPLDINESLGRAGP